LRLFFFAVVLTVRREWSDFFVYSAWKDLIFITLIIGVGFYGLMFLGIRQTTAGNASIVALMEVFFSFVILRLWGKEFYGLKRMAGAVLMLVGAFTVLFRGADGVNIGDLLILFATAIAPVGNFFQQRARLKVESNFILFVRSIGAGFFLLVLAYLTEKHVQVLELHQSIIFLFINGFFLLGLSKIFWIEGIHLIPITKANSLSSIKPAFTLVFAFFLLHEVPTLWQILGLVPIIIGVWLLTSRDNNFAISSIVSTSSI